MGAHPNGSHRRDDPVHHQPNAENVGQGHQPDAGINQQRDAGEHAEQPGRDRPSPRRNVRVHNRVEGFDEAADDPEQPQHQWEHRDGGQRRPQHDDTGDDGQHGQQDLAETGFPIGTHGLDEPEDPAHEQLGPEDDGQGQDCRTRPHQREDARDQRQDPECQQPFPGPPEPGQRFGGRRSDLLRCVRHGDLT